MLTRPKIRFESAEGDSSPIEATLMDDGRIRLVSDADTPTMRSTWLTPAEVREFALELLGLADAADIIHPEG